MKLIKSLLIWFGDVGRWVWAVVGVALTCLGLYAFVGAARRHWQLLALVAMTVLFIGSFWAYHKLRMRTEELTAGPLPETRQDAARRLLKAQADRGRKIAALRYGDTAAQAMWERWRTGTYMLLGEMCGQQVAAAFIEAGGAPSQSDSQTRTIRQVFYLDGLLTGQPLPLLGDWKPPE